MNNQVNVHVFGNQVPCAGTTAASGTLDIGTVNILALRVPSDDEGGGITVTNFYAHVLGTIAAASAPQFEICTMSSAGGTIAGTVGSIGSVAYTGQVPKTGTVSDGWCDQDDGDYFVVVKHKQIAALAIGSNSCWVTINYQQGR